MAKRQNELFIGKEHMNIEGRSIKHPALIHHYATVNLKKVSDHPIELIGLDLETNHLTSELKLLGFYHHDKYAYYTDNFLEVLFGYIKYAKSDNCVIAYWNRLDPFVLYKQFLYLMKPDDIEVSLSKYGHISGEWNKKDASWDVEPVTKVKIGNYIFGIKNVIRSSIQFYFYDIEMRELKTVWAYDIAQLYHYGLEREAKDRLPYYTKVDESAHLVDWERFNNDEEYKNNIVLKSNELDARAVRDLGIIIQNEFKTAFEYYPKSLISQGSLARASIVAKILKKYESLEDEKEITKNALADIKSIGIINYYDEWLTKYGQDVLKDLYALSCEAYSGGYIEAIRYGYAKEAYYADLASAYPAVEVELYDLRHAKITHGTGTPPHIDKSYCFIRGVVDIPEDVQFHPITIKHPIYKSTNIRAVGQYKASYTIDERDYLLELGATFTDEVWYNIETTGELSLLASIVKEFIDLRTKLKADGNSAEYMAKIAANSTYGILFEATDTYEESLVEKQINYKEKDTYYKDALKRFQKRINLDAIRSDLEYHLGSDAKKLYAMWHSSMTRQTPEMVKQELEAMGIYLESNNNVDLMLEIDALYRKDAYIEVNDTIKKLETIKMGYRAGEFFNPIFASYITARTRIKLARAANEIEKAGGKVILLMTDSVFWTGNADMMPRYMYKDKKTLGYFEKPELIKDMLCLGSGRYGYTAFNKKTSKWEKMVSKKRGLNATALQDPEGIMITDFSWYDALKQAAQEQTEKMVVNVRTLISVGLVYHTKELKNVILDEKKNIVGTLKISYNDLGKIIKQKREVDLIVGGTKRFYDKGIHNPKILLKSLVDTKSLDLGYGMTGNDSYVDQTLPELRSMMMLKEAKTSKEKNKKNIDKAQKKYYNKNKSKFKKQYQNKRDSIRSVQRDKYQFLKGLGYSTKLARKLSTWSIEKINNKLTEDLKV
jgi:hypothetical protein